MGSINCIFSYFFQSVGKFQKKLASEDIQRYGVLPYKKFFKSPIDILSFHQF